MKVYDLLRALIAAFTVHLSADPANADAVKAAQDKAADLQAQLDAAKAKLATDESSLADLGTPLSDDETGHLNTLLSGALSTPPVAVPEPPAAPPATEPVQDTLPGSAS